MGDLPDQVQRFIAEHINSVEQLETLLLLRSDPRRAWRAAEVSEELATSGDSAAMRLADLESRGFLVAEGEPAPRYTYARVPPDVEADLTAVAETYAKRRVRIISAIFAEPASPAESFSDAFRLWKDRDRG